MPSAARPPHPIGHDFRVWYSSPRPVEGVRLRGLGLREEMRPGLVDRPQGTGDWMVMAFPAETRIGDTDLAGPLLMIWPPGAAQRYGQPARRWLHSWFHAEGLEDLVAVCRPPLATPILGFAMERLEGPLRVLHAELAREHAVAAAVAAQVESVLRCAAAVGSSLADDGGPWADLRAHLEGCFDERLTLAGLAQRFGLSPNHLCTGFRRRFGVTPIAFVIALRLDRARLLLGDRNRTVAEVAEAVGYPSLHHFTRLYRARFGRSPRALLPRPAGPSGLEGMTDAGRATPPWTNRDPRFSQGK